MKNLSLNSLILALIIALSGVQAVVAMQPAPAPTVDASKVQAEEYRSGKAKLKTAKANLATAQQAQSKLAANATDAEKAKATKDVTEATEALKKTNEAFEQLKKDTPFLGRAKVNANDAFQVVKENKVKTAVISTAVVVAIASVVAAYKYLVPSQEVEQAKSATKQVSAWEKVKSFFSSTK